MDFTSDTPRAERTIAGIKVNVIQPFAEGQPLTAGTAAMLNQTLAENFSNNLRKAFSEAADGTDFQAMADNYMATYQPGVRSGGGGGARIVDPVEREARKIAKAKATQIVIAKGLKVKDLGEGFADVVDRLYAKYEDQFLAEGKKIVAALEKAKKASAELDFSDLDLGIAS